MKKIMKRTVLFGSIAASLLLFSFSPNRGGDSFRVYFNGRLMLEQFVHAEKSVKSLEINPSSENDKLDVYYSHCGQVGKSRFLTIRDENDKPIHVLEFPDAVNGNEAMSFSVKQLTTVLKNKVSKFRISYSSKELPKGKILATIDVGKSVLAGK